MYAGFKFKADKEQMIQLFGEDKREIGKNHLNGQKAIVFENLKNYVIQGTETLDGTFVEANWFPQIDVDIFISHSHADVDFAQMLAGWLYEEFGLNCFIDSNVWGYADELTTILNDKYSDRRNGEGDYSFIYSHKKCLSVSKHVDTMLTIALHKMIDRSETVLLLDTPNAICSYGSTIEDASYSPWIYSELVCSSIVRKQIPDRLLSTLLTESLRHDSFALEQKGMEVLYKVPTNHLIPLDINDLEYWNERYISQRTSLKALDILYQIKNIFPQNIYF